jgi:unsaturated rhamnogalacturonyl hydrolase
MADTGADRPGDVAETPAPDAPPDLAADAGEPDVSPDAAPDLAPDLAADSAPDLAADTAPDIAPDAPPDLPPPPPDLAPDLAPDAAPPFDWSVAMVESTMRRYPSAGSVGNWSYPTALLMHGIYLVYRRTHVTRYLDYVKAWGDARVDDGGRFVSPLDKLDDILPGLVMLDLYDETKAAKWKLAADQLRQRFDTYPRTSEGGFWHKTFLPQQLWLDGVYMSMPFFLRHATLFGDASKAGDEVVKQLTIQHDHLADAATGLYFHGYDESGAASWADPVTKHSPEFWCRATGWYGMATVDVLDRLPAAHPGRAQLVKNVEGLVAAIARYQDPATGRWFQVVDKGSLASNWLETSCSSMFTYVTAKAVARGYAAASYAPVARRGLDGVLQKISLGPNGLTYLDDICVGTPVGDLAFYLARDRQTNDNHGLGSFLLMFEQVHN